MTAFNRSYVSPVCGLTQKDVNLCLNPIIVSLTFILWLWKSQSSQLLSQQSKYYGQIRFEGE